MTFVSPINTITLDCSGNVLPNALLIADVDSNKINELLVGTQDGELLIFKASRNLTDIQLWRRAHGLGFITAIAVGSLVTNVNEPRPIICVANAEGTIHLFLLRSNLHRSRVRSAGGTINSGNNRNDSRLQLYGPTIMPMDDEQQQQQIPIAFSQQVTCNPKILLIQEFNECEKQLIIGFSNRRISIFNSMITEDFDGRLSGRFVLKESFNISEQIHTLSSKRISTKDYELIVAQPNGNLFRFNPNEDNCRTLSSDTNNQTVIGWTEAIALDKFSEDTVYATICQDRINIFSNQLNKILNSIPLSVKIGHLCGLQKGPMTKDNYNQLITISSVDGDTFIVDRHSNITRFRPPLSSNIGCGGGNDSIGNTNFSDQIQAFTSGTLGDNQIFCYIYVLTHNDKIIIVHSIETNNEKTTDLQMIINGKLKQELTSEKLNDILHPSQ